MDQSTVTIDAIGTQTTGDKLIFTATASAELASGEELPEGAGYVYTYKWQYAQRQYNWWSEQPIEESDWKDCITGNEKKNLDDSSHNPFYGSETESQGQVRKLTAAGGRGQKRCSFGSDCALHSERTGKRWR